ncbi:glycosyltransferase [Mycobacterium sp. GA-2829]|uniref:glycosyltransferase n=1 Tax=Mycobacterium sp. GA-2829 TaxID=1772283 RepID=UPI0018D2586E|nr:glycosyltransferase [Mycobacterium sp. GA-2829]
MIAVASVPAAHPYVRAITDPEHIVLLDDPRPPGATSPEQWWPPQFLDSSYLADESGYFDVMHVHFGFDATPPAELRGVIDVLTTRRKPLVLTVHDLHNPHFVDPRDHLARLDVLVPAADAVVTLTDGAARAIHERWGRRATVLPHPRVLPLTAIRGARTATETPVVAVHAKSLRANIDPLPVVDALLAVAEPGWRLRLDLDANYRDSPRANLLTAERIDALAARGVDVRVHPRFTDGELAQYLSEIDALVLPYRFGTHSGWVEACYDAGVAAIVPDCGFFHEQHGDPTYRHSADAAMADSLRRAVAEGLARRSTEDRRGERARQRDDVRRQMTSIYRAALAKVDAA